MDTLIGILTTNQEITQKGPEQVGNAWRTIIARMNNVKAGKFTANASEVSSENYNEEEWTSLNDVETVLKGVGISLRKSSSEFKSSEVVLNEIAQQWDTLTTIQQSAIANAMAGTRQRENFIATMENWTQVQAYAELSADSLGQAAKKMEAYNDSLEAAKNRLQAALESFATNGVITTIEKWLTNLGTFFAENGVLVIGLIAVYTVMQGLTTSTGAAHWALDNFTKALNTSTSILSKMGSKDENANTKGKLKDLGKGLLKTGAGALGALGMSGAGELLSNGNGTVKLISGVLGQQVGSFLGEHGLSIFSAGTKSIATSVGRNGIQGLGRNIVTGGALKAIGGKTASIIGVQGLSSGSLAFLGGGLLTAVLAAVVGIGFKIYKKIKAENLKAAQEAYQTAANEYTSKKTVGANAERYAELAKGVNSLGENVSLTDEEYSEFLQLSNNLADAFPELVNATDSLGNKFVLLGKTTTEIIKGINDEIDSAQAIANSRLTDDILLKNNAEQASSNINKNTLNQNQAKELLNQMLAVDKSNAYSYIIENKSDVEYLKSLGINIGNGLIKRRISGVYEIDEAYKDNIINILKNNLDSLEGNLSTLGAEYLETYFAFLNQSASDIIKPEDYNSSQNAITSKILANQNIVDSTKQDDADFNNKLNVIATAINPLLTSTDFQESYGASANNYSTLGKYNEAVTKGTDLLTQQYQQWVKNDEIGKEKADEILKTLGYQIDDSGNITKTNNLYDVLMGLASQSNNATEIKSAIGGMTFAEGASAKEILATQWGKSLTKEELLTATHRDAAASNTYEDLEAYKEETKKQRSNLQTAMLDSYMYDEDVAYSKFYKDLVTTDDNGQFVSKSDEYIDEQYAQYSTKIREGIKAAAKQFAEGLNAGVDQTTLTAKLDIQLDTLAANQEIEATAAITKKKLFEAFSNVDLGTDGIISNFTELKSIVDEMVNSFDRLKNAFDEQNSRGKLSIQTVMELITTDSNYLDILEVKNGQITLVSDAQEIMAKKQLEAAKAGVQQLITEKEQELQKIKLTLTSDDYVAKLNNEIRVLNAKAKATARSTYMEQAGVNVTLAAKAAWNGNKEEATKYISEAKKLVGDVISGNIDYGEIEEVTLSKDQIKSYTEQQAQLEKEIALLKEMGVTFDSKNALSTLTNDIKSSLDDITDKLEKIKAIGSALNKEYSQWNSYISGSKEDIGTYYSDKMGNLQEQLAEVQILMAKYTKSSKEYYEYLQQARELQVEINNLNDEKIQDYITILESAGVVNDELLEQYDNLLNVADTYEEWVERTVKKGEVRIKIMEKEVQTYADLISVLENSKPQEWGIASKESGTAKVTDQIKKYYDTLKTYYKEQKSIIENTLTDVSDLTDEEVNQLRDKLNDVIKAAKDAERQMLSDQKSEMEEQYSSLKNFIQKEYIDLYTKQKEVVQEAYDKEIEKLTDKNEAIARTNKLLELQQNLLKANKEKERVYRAGVGWVYQANRTKQKEAQQALDDFYLQDSIDDLTSARDEELKVLDERIKNWQNYLDMLEKQFNAYGDTMDRERVLELLQVTTIEEAQAKLTQDMESFNAALTNLNETSASQIENFYQNYTSAANTFIEEYIEITKALQKANESFLNTLLTTKSLLNGQTSFSGTITIDSNGNIVANGTYTGNNTKSSVTGDENKVFTGGGITVSGDESTYFNYLQGEIDTNKAIMDKAAKALNSEVIADQLYDAVYWNGTWYDWSSYQTARDKVQKQYDNAAYYAKEYQETLDTLINNKKAESTYSSSLSEDYGWSDDDDNYNSYTSSGIDYGALWTAAAKDKDEDKMQAVHEAKAQDLAAQAGVSDWKQFEADHYDPDSGRWYASGIENGPVTYTGLAMLHGSPSKPEYVLNSDQAYSLLRYMATNKPEYTSNLSKSGDTVYDFGGVVMNGVNDPEQFFSELQSAMSRRYNNTKNRK